MSWEDSTPGERLSMVVGDSGRLRTQVRELQHVARESGKSVEAMAKTMGELEVQSKYWETNAKLATDDGNKTEALLIKAQARVAELELLLIKEQEKVAELEAKLQRTYEYCARLEGVSKESGYGDN